MSNKKNKLTLEQVIRDKLLMKQIIKTIWIILFTLLLNYLATFIITFPKIKIVSIGYYLIPNKECFKIYMIVIVIMALLCAFDWYYYYLYKPKLEANGEKGSADWANERIEELKDNSEKLASEEKLVRILFDEEFPTQRGVILNTDESSYYVDSDTTHNAVLGITGAGKSQTSVFPFIELISRPVKPKSKNNYLQESMIINDPKGELCSSMAPMLKERGYDVKILNLEEPYYSDSYDPFKLIKESYTRSFTKSVDIQGDVSEAVNLTNAFSLILTNDPTAKDKFWQTTSKDLMNGIILAMMEDLVPYKPKMATPYLTRTLLSEFANTLTEDDERRLDWFFQEREIGNRAKSMASSAISASDKTKESIISNTLANLSLFADDGIAKMTSNNTIEFNDLIEKPTAVFLICPDDDQSRWALASIFIEQSYYALTKTIKRDYGAESPRRINYILDEFAQMPPIPDMHVKLSMSRSRNIRWTLYLQDFNQLESKYDKNAPTIKNNCTNIIYLLTTDKKTADEISGKLGKKTVVQKSISSRQGELDSNVTHSLDAQPLMHSDELMRMPFEQGVIIRAGKKPIKSHFRAAFRYLKLQKKNTKELVDGISEHAKISLQDCLHYLEDDNALEIYNQKNKKVIKTLLSKEIQYENVDSNLINQITEIESTDKIIQRLKEYLFDEFAISNSYEKEIDTILNFRIRDKIDRYKRDRDWDSLVKEVMTKIDEEVEPIESTQEVEPIDEIKKELEKILIENNFSKKDIMITLDFKIDNLIKKYREDTNWNSLVDEVMNITNKN